MGTRASQPDPSATRVDQSTAAGFVAPVDVSGVPKRIGRYEVPIAVFEDVRVEVKTLVKPIGGELPPEEELEAMAAAEEAADAAAEEEAAESSAAAEAAIAEVEAAEEPDGPEAESPVAVEPEPEAGEDEPAEAGDEATPA